MKTTTWTASHGNDWDLPFVIVPINPSDTQLIHVDKGGLCIVNCLESSFFFSPIFLTSLENVDIVCIVMDLLWNCPKFME